MKAGSISESSSKVDLDDLNLLLKNTQQNEYLNVYRSPGYVKDYDLTYSYYQNSKIEAALKPCFEGALIGEFLGSKSRKLSTDFHIELPEIRTYCDLETRNVSLRRNTQGDFGFSLRRGMKHFNQGKIKEVSRSEIVFAEPSVIGKENITGLLPGDQLVEVNNENVVGKSREEVISIIKNVGSDLELKVAPVPELSELTKRNLAAASDPDTVSSNKPSLARSISSNSLVQVTSYPIGAEYWNQIMLVFRSTNAHTNGVIRHGIDLHVCRVILSEV